eukprot:maker-scaffold_40-snap-gene-1.49-mRNA-1 protein AED:0.33 eAED:0.33 QI:91/1/1/1/1/1/2/102/211
MSKTFGARTEYAMDVILNVYDLNATNFVLYPLGLGFYHTGIEINGEEYTFAGGGGIFPHKAKSPPLEGNQKDLNLRESILLGQFTGGTQGLQQSLNKLKDSGYFSGDKYKLVSRNCNDFSRAFALSLLGKKYLSSTWPWYVNRLAYIGTFIPCIERGPDEVSEDSIAKEERESFTGKGNRLSEPPVVSLMGENTMGRDELRQLRMRKFSKK